MATLVISCGDEVGKDPIDREGKSRSQKMYDSISSHPFNNKPSAPESSFSKDTIYLEFVEGFVGDTVQVFVNNKPLEKSIMETNRSTGTAGCIWFKKEKKQFVKIRINHHEQPFPIKITKNFGEVYYDRRSGKIEVIFVDSLPIRD